MMPDWRSGKINAKSSRLNRHKRNQQSSLPRQGRRNTTTQIPRGQHQPTYHLLVQDIASCQTTSPTMRLCRMPPPTRISPNKGEESVAEWRIANQSNGLAEHRVYLQASNRHLRQHQTPHGAALRVYEMVR